MSECETTCDAARSRRDIVEELESYGHYQHLWIVNRDGDKFYIECPDCHNTDLTSKRIYGCTKCHTQFTVHPEDGTSYQTLITEMGPSRGREEIKIIGKGQDSYFKQVLYPRNYSKIDEIKKSWPNAHITTLSNDL